MFSNEDHLYIRDEVIDVMKTTKDIIASDPNSTDEPFYIFNIDDIVKKHQLWFNNMPMIAPHYAVKCNDNDVVLKILASLGTSFDCASKTGNIQIQNDLSSLH
jgi:ornithine decarboxylase